MPALINVAVLKNPLNWAIIFIVIVWFIVSADIVLHTIQKLRNKANQT